MSMYLASSAMVVTILCQLSGFLVAFIDGGQGIHLSSKTGL